MAGYVPPTGLNPGTGAPLVTVGDQRIKTGLFLLGFGAVGAFLGYAVAGNSGLVVGGLVGAAAPVIVVKAALGPNFTF